MEAFRTDLEYERIKARIDRVEAAMAAYSSVTECDPALIDEAKSLMAEAQKAGMPENLSAGLRSHVFRHQRPLRMQALKEHLAGMLLSGEAAKKD